MPATDAFSGAQDSAEAQKRALLAAVAQQGSQGRATYDAQQAAAQAARQQAVKTAAAGPQAPPANAPLPSGITPGPGGGSVPIASAAGVAQARQSTGMGAEMDAANSTYFDQIKAAIPVTEQLISAFQKEQDTNFWNDTVAANQEKADDARRRQYELEDRAYTRSTRDQDRQWTNEDRYYEIAKRNAEAEGGNPLAVLVDRLGGSDLAKPQLAAAIKEAFKRAQTGRMQKERVGGKLITEMLPGMKMDDAGKAAVVEQVAGELGLPEGVLAQFLGKSNPALPAPVKASDGKPNATTVERVRNKPRYHEEVQEALDSVAEWIAADYTLAEARARVAAAIRADASLAKQPVLRDLVIQDALSG